LNKSLKILFILSLLFFLVRELNAQIEKDTGYIVHIGESAPDLSLQLISADTIRLNKLKGKVVVLQFTASWCSVCRKEIPHLEKEVWLPNKDNDFLLIGVDYDEPLDKVKSYVEKMQITYPMALDPGADIFAKFAKKESGVTRNVVIDKSGRIAFLTRLYDKDEFEKMKSEIARLLKQ